MVFERVPLHEQSIALRHFMGTLQRDRFAALGTLEDRPGLFHAGFKVGFHARLDVNLRDFEDHATIPCGERWGEGRIMMRPAGSGKSNNGWKASLFRRLL